MKKSRYRPMLSVTLAVMVGVLYADSPEKINPVQAETGDSNRSAGPSAGNDKAASSDQGNQKVVARADEVGDNKLPTKVFMDMLGRGFYKDNVGKEHDVESVYSEKMLDLADAKRRLKCFKGSFGTPLEVHLKKLEMIKVDGQKVDGDLYKSLKDTLARSSQSDSLIVIVRDVASPSGLRRWNVVQLDTPNHMLESYGKTIFVALEVVHSAVLPSCVVVGANGKITKCNSLQFEKEFNRN